MAAMLDVTVGVGGGGGRETGTERSEWGGKMLGEVRLRANSFGERNCLCKCSSALICFINLKWQPFNPNLESFFLVPREPCWVSSVLCVVRHVIQPCSCVPLTLSKVLHCFYNNRVVTRWILPGRPSTELGCDWGHTSVDTVSPLLFVIKA